MTTTVFAIDDHAPFLATVALVVAAMDDFELIGTARSAEAVLAMEGVASAASVGSADLLLIDFLLPGANGLQLARCLADRHQPRPTVVLMSSYDREALPMDEPAWRCVDEFVPKMLLSPEVLLHCWRAHI